MKESNDFEMRMLRKIYVYLIFVAYYYVEFVGFVSYTQFSHSHSTFGVIVNEHERIFVIA